MGGKAEGVGSERGVRAEGHRVRGGLKTSLKGGREGGREDGREDRRKVLNCCHELL